MKKMTIALMSLVMLILTMGKASAETIPTPNYTPTSGSTITPGTTINFELTDEVKAEGLVYVLYTINDETTKLESTPDDLTMALSGGSSLDFSLAIYMGGEWMQTCVINEMGSVTLRARLAYSDANEENLIYSEIITATYTVAGEAEKLKAPEFNPQGGEVDPGTMLEITNGYEEDETAMCYIFYVVDGTDADLEGSLQDLMGGDVKQYGSPIKLMKAQTIKARTVKIDMIKQTIADKSEITTASYTIKGGDVEDKTVPKLTLSASEVTVPAGGSVTFSITVDPQEYVAPSGVYGFAIDASSKKGDIAKLEYQIGETVNDQGWQTYPEQELASIGNSFVVAIPNNKDNKDQRLLSMERGKFTVHYRMMFKLKEGNSTAPKLTFVVVEAARGIWTMTSAEEPIATASVTFTVDESQKPTAVAKPVFDLAAGEVEPNTPLAISSATPGAQIAYVMVKDGEADKTIDLTDPESYTLYAAPVRLRKADGPMTVKAVAFLQYTDVDKVLKSEETTAHYTFPQVSAPTFSPKGGKVEYGSLVYIYGDGDIYYTIDGSEPTTESAKYFDALHMDKIDDKPLTYGETVTLKAIAVVDGETSKVAEATFMIKEMGVMTLTPERQALLKGETFEFDLAMDPKDFAGSMMCLGVQMDGYEALTAFKFRKKGETTYTDLLPELQENEGTILFFENTLPYPAAEMTWEYVLGVAAETDVEAINMNLGISNGSDRPFCGVLHTWNIIELALPTFSPQAGTVAKNTAVTLSTTEEAAEIRYTTDGSEPTATSPKYETPIQITTKTTVKAVTVKYGLCSKVAEAVYTLVATPSFSVPSGVVERNSTVELNTATAGAKIYYTTDGSEPTVQSTEYSAAIKIDKPMTLKAIAILDGEQSLISEVTYVFVKAPVFSVATGKVLQNTELTLTADAGAKVYYTVDGSEPTVQSTEYTSPIKLERKTTVKAIAVMGDELSLVAEAAYVVTPIAPTFSQPAGAVESGTAISLTAVGDAEIRVSVMGTVTATSALYKNPIKITGEKTISAAAFLDGEMSEIVTAKYTVLVKDPVFTPAPGAVEKGTKVEIVSGNASIRYTLDGTEPSDDNGRWYNSYTGLVIDEAVTIKAYAINGSVRSNTVTAVYWIIGEQKPVVEVAAPTFSVAAGEVEKGTQVGLATATLGAKIYYTVDGSEPTAEAAEYAEPIVINADVTIKAIAMFGSNKSEVATAAYTIKAEGGEDPGETPETVAMPTFSVPAGKVDKGTQVSIACATEGATIYYTVDGSEPTAEATEYKEAISIDSNLTVKAIAVKDAVKSEVATAAYTVKVANEGLELAGVNLYPNPSHGQFHIELPVAARVEVFGSNGVLRQRVEAGAGLLTLTVDHSGVYFIRITGEGRTTVKRVVVR